MKSFLIKHLRRFLRFFGIRVDRIDFSKEMLFPKNLEIDLLFDVGANNGQYVELIRSQGFNKEIVSFEPLYQEHNNLKSLSSIDSHWHIFERCAIGNFNGSTVINISQNSFSSSILTMLESHIEAAPASKYIGSETVPICKLSDIWKSNYSKYKNIGVKIDVQGFEMEVLLGMEEILNLVNFIQIELSLISVYESQKLYFEIDHFLRKNGFQLWKVVPGFTHPNNGRQLQFDGIYIK